MSEHRKDADTSHDPDERSDPAHHPDGEGPGDPDDSDPEDTPT
jgi:hypothetical protein